MLRRSAELMASAELLVVATIAPALLFPNPTRLLALLIVPVLWWGVWLTTGRVVPRTPMNAALWVLLTMVAVSLYATFDVRFSLGKVSGVALGVLVFWSITRWVSTRARLRRAAAAFLLAGGGLAIVGLLGTNWINKFPAFDAVIGRLPKAIRGVPGAEEGFQPNAVAGSLVLFVPLQVALLAHKARRWLSPRPARAERGTWLIVVHAWLLTLTAGTLVLTQSRGAWVGLLVATVVFLAWHSRLTRAFAVAIAASVVIVAFMLGPERFFTLAVSQSGPEMAADVSGRMEVWSRAIYGIQDFPFTGMGMNTFRRVMPALYPTFLTPPNVDIAHAHNHLLQAALDLGIPGLVAYASVWILTGGLLVMVYRGSKERVYRAMAGGLGAGFIAHFVFSMTDAIPLGAKVGVLFWFALALAVALHHVTLGITPGSRTASQHEA